MPESKAHEDAKKKAAGKGGRTELPLKGGRRLDAITARGGTATEVERSGEPTKLAEAAKRLQQSGALRKILQVPQKSMSVAKEVLDDLRVGVTIKNLSGTKSIRVRRKNKVVIGIAKRGKARFVTAFVADSFRTLLKIKSSPKWC